MEILADIQKCCGCHACYNTCTVQAIQMKKNSQGFLYPVINQLKCIECKQCVKVCPVLKEKSAIRSVDIYACYDKNKRRRMKSASGGFFSVLAEHVLKQNGIVFGAAFNEQMEVEHVGVDAVENLVRLKGSKYVQSSIGKQYSEAKQCLELGKQVLFSGTPCQIEGLKSFLGKEYDNLICIDLVCHGVPSPEVWKTYLKELGNGKKIESVEFRNKQNGIVNAPLEFVFEDGTVITQNYKDNAFIKGYINNLYLRDSCYECKFKGIQRVSDFTIGDFWGIETVAPQFGDQYGISLIIVQSKKGKEIFEKIKKELKWIKCSKNDAIKENPCIIQSVAYSENREKFFEIYSQQGVIKTIEFLLRQTFGEKCKKRFSGMKYEVKYMIYKVYKKIINR